MKQNKNREILLFLCTNPDSVWRRILRFRQAFLQNGDRFDFAVASFLPDQDSRTVMRRYAGIEIAHHIFGPDKISTLGYPRKATRKPFKLIPGNTDLVTLFFWKQHPEYERIWLMEDDIEYTGDPRTIFTDLVKTEGDLLASHVAKCYESWTYASMFQCGNANVAKSDLWLTFLPFFRINRRSLELIDQAYLNGWDGHNEMVWPTVLKLHRYSVVDIGGQGDYVTDAFRNKHYIGVPGNAFDKAGSFGTMTIRLRPGNVENVLWHPIKRPKAWARQKTKRMISIAKWHLSKLSRFRPRPEAGSVKQ